MLMSPHRRRFVDHDILAVDLSISSCKFVQRFYELWFTTVQVFRNIAWEMSQKEADKNQTFNAF